MERSTLSHGSVPHTRWVSSRVGACTETIGSAVQLRQRAQRAGLRVTGSVHTITSTAS